MADAKVSALTELTSVATGDLIPIVDISDTTMAASGTTKKITQDNLLDPNLPTVSVDNEIALFSSTTGRVLKRASSTGIAKVTSGVLSTITPASGVETFITTPSSANLASAVTDETGSGSLVFGTSPTITTPTINTPTIKTWTGWNTVTDSWSYASDDSPTFVITVPSGAASLYGVGWKVQLTQTTAKYFIITAVTDTTLTVYGGTDYTLANAAISSIYVSPMKAPLGFPLDPTKWMQTTEVTSEQTQATPTQNTWYNVGSSSLVVPIGAWNLGYMGNFAVNDNSSTTSFFVTLSSANNSESDNDFTALCYFAQTGVTDNLPVVEISRNKPVTLAAKTTYYLNMRTTLTSQVNLRHTTSIGGGVAPLIIRAVCAYL